VLALAAQLGLTESQQQRVTAIFEFDLLHLDGDDVGSQPLIERNLPARPASVSHGAPSC
jgi:ATP-dependent DNA ligase